MYVTGMGRPWITNLGQGVKKEEISHSGKKSWAKFWVLEKPDEGEILHQGQPVGSRKRLGKCFHDQISGEFKLISSELRKE